MFKGTPKYPDGAINDLVARNGGDQNAFTGPDYTGYYQNLAVDRLPLMMEMEADRMKNLTLREDEVITEREVIIEERRMRIDNVPASMMGERLDNALWMGNHYGIPIIGWPEEMRGLDQEDALSFYRAHYTPENAILVVAGDITAAQLKPLAEKYYGVLKPTADWDGKPRTRSRSTELPPIAHTRVTFAHERVSQPQWVREYIAPSYNVGAREDVHALELFAEIMGGGSTAKLYRTLVVEQKVAADFSTYYNSDTVSYGSFSISMTPSPGVTPEAAEAAFETALAALLKDGITDADVERARGRMLAGLAFAKDSPISAARQVGGAMAVGLTLEEIETWPDAIAKVTADQVRAAARKIFSEFSSATGVLLPAAQPVEGAAP